MRFLLLLFSAGLALAVAEPAAIDSTLAPEPAGKANQIWIGIRTDGLAGLGTEMSPLDGSTEARMDAILAALPANTTLHLLPGTYTVTPIGSSGGGYITNIPIGTTIIGAGMNLTTIKAGVVTNANTVNWVISNCTNGLVNCSISNLTIDCNGANQKTAHVAVDGVQLNDYSGSVKENSSASYVHVKNGVYASGGGTRADAEWFGIGVRGSPADGAICTIDHCIVDDFFSGTQGFTAIAADSAETNNVVRGNGSRPDAGGGYQNAYAPSVFVANNQCYDTTTGVYADTGPPGGNIEITHNTFNTINNAVHIYGASSLHHVSITSNIFTINEGYALKIGSSANACDDLVISGNKFYLTNTTSSPTQSSFLEIAFFTNTRIFDNIFPTSLLWKVSAAFENMTPLSHNLQWYRNKYDTGASFEIFGAKS